MQVHSFRLGAALALILLVLPTLAAATEPTGIKQITRYGEKQNSTLVSTYLGDEIQVCFNGDVPIDPSEWQLFLDDRAVTDKKSVRPADQPECMIFTLQRNDVTMAAWNALLGRPKASSRNVAIAIGRDTKDHPAERFVPQSPTINLVLDGGGWGFWGASVTLAVLLLALAAFLVATKCAILRDRLLPVLEPKDQSYSLGRLQMTFWFVLIASAFIFLWVYIGDYNTVTLQAIMLMGISVATGLGAIAANGTNDNDLKSALQALNKVGWKTPADVLPGTPPSSDELAAIEQIKAYKTQGIFKDLFDDENGAALHRLQVVFWVLVLGVVFLVGVWQDLAMPMFSDTLLALMAVSGGSYVGFKVAEKT